MCVSPTHRRLDKIAANLAAQPKKRADYKKTLPPKPLRQGLLQHIKKSACELEYEAWGLVACADNVLCPVVDA